MAKVVEPTIRLARSIDCVELAELSRVAIEYGLRWRWKPSRILGVIRHKECTVITARNPSDLSLLGFAAMEFKSTSAHLSLLATSQHYRRQGVASKLLQWLEQSAVTAGLDYVALEVREQNQGAINFYEAHGYHIDGVATGYYDGSENAYRMRRHLIAPDIALRRP